MIQAQELFDAIKTNNLAKVTALLDSNAAFVNSKDNAGNTPLHQAAISGSMEIAEYLLLKGADLNAANAQQNTPLTKQSKAGRKTSPDFSSRKEPILIKSMSISIHLFIERH